MTLLDPIASLALPTNALVNRRVPRTLLLDHGTRTASDKRITRRTLPALHQGWIDTVVALQAVKVIGTLSVPATSVALEVVENKGLNNMVIFFSVMSFGKSVVLNDLVFRLGQFVPEKSVGFRGSTRICVPAAVARDGTGGLLRVRET